MEFCPKCGGMLIEKRKNFGCAKCTYSTKSKVKIESTENIKGKEGGLACKFAAYVAE